MKTILAGLILATSVSPAFAFDGAWDDLVAGREADKWRQSQRELEEPEYPDPDDYVSGRIEPGHIPYGCGHITGNARAREECRRDWEASDPNDLLWYGR